MGSKLKMFQNCTILSYFLKLTIIPCNKMAYLLKVWPLPTGNAAFRAIYCEQKKCVDVTSLLET